MKKETIELMDIMLLFVFLGRNFAFYRVFFIFLNGFMFTVFDCPTKVSDRLAQVGSHVPEAFGSK